MSEERRLVTVLFGDVVGSTSLGEAMDPEDLRRLLGRFYTMATDVIAEHGGTLEKFIGDAAMAIFGLPQTHDDDARRALDAAMALRDRLRDDVMLNGRLPIRIGLNTGEVVASRDPVALEPLDEESIGQLVRGLLEGAAPELVPLVAGRSEGNPFYAEEIVRSLLERGVDLSDATGVAGAAARLPDTVQATVLARLDSLDHSARRVVQLGSVFGRSFTTDGVASIEGEREDHASAVEQLIERELLRPGGRGELTFRHIIIRDVAYGTLTRVERSALHTGAGRWLEEGAVDREDELAELVAFHYREAAVLSANVDSPDPAIRTSAVRWLRRAADVAAGGARGITEAMGHLRAAIELAGGAEQAVNARASGRHPRLRRRLGAGVCASLAARSRARPLARLRAREPRSPPDGDLPLLGFGWPAAQ